MRIAVVRVGSVAHFPPAQSLVACLLDLGHTVDFLASDVHLMPEWVRVNPSYSAIELGSGGSLIGKARSFLRASKLVQEHIENNIDDIDVVWTTTDISARVLGDAAFKCIHVMQLSELVEYVPLLRKGESCLHSRKVVNMARSAARVVVPEYNRAHIQKVWWDLPDVPAILPNKPYPDSLHLEPLSASDVPKPMRGKKILLYQGVYEKDRQLGSFAKALDYLDSEYVLALMGKAVISGSDEVSKLIRGNERVVDLGFHPAPSHLSYTRFGHIGLLPYTAGKCNRFSSLNALYCAPNKIWEYARFGLPMIGSDVPGLTFAFDKGRMGIAVNLSKPREIAEAVNRIDAEYETFSRNARAYYQNVDFRADVQRILGDATHE